MNINEGIESIKKPLQNDSKLEEEINLSLENLSEWDTLTLLGVYQQSTLDFQELQAEGLPPGETFQMLLNFYDLVGLVVEELAIREKSGRLEQDLLAHEEVSNNDK